MPLNKETKPNISLSIYMWDSKWRRIFTLGHPLNIELTSNHLWDKLNLLTTVRRNLPCFKNTHIYIYIYIYISNNYRRRIKWIKIKRIEDSVDISIRGFEDYITKSKERLITATRNNTDNIRVKIGKRNRKKNNCTDISRDKLAKSHASRHGHS